MYTKISDPSMLMPLNTLMLRLSAQVIGHTGASKGKYYKMLACHSQMLSSIIMSPVSTSSSVTALDTYHKLIQIFGQNNAYIVVIGVAQQLATKKKNKKYFGGFLERVILP